MQQRYQFPFKENFATINGTRLHYVDEGSGPVIWLMHGNTTWSYLYRKMIPVLVGAGYRCIAPDLMGFGLSSIPAAESAYSLKRHVALMTGLLKHLDVYNITTVGQDWGGPISLRYAIENKENIRAIVILNTFIERFAASVKEQDELGLLTGPLPPGFDFLFKRPWSGFVVKRMDVFRKFVWQKWRTGNRSRLLGAGFRRPVDERAMAQYLKVHTKARNRAGLATFPAMIPNRANHPNANYINEIRRELENWHVPKLVAWADGDLAWPLSEGARIAQVLPNTEFYMVHNAGHFLQEDAGVEVAERMVKFLKSLPE